MTGTADINVEKIPQLPGYISNEPQVTIQSDKKVLVESGINEKYSKTQQMAADIASHRQVTRKILHKYSKERTNFEKNEQPCN